MTDAETSYTTTAGSDAFDGVSIEDLFAGIRRWKASLGSTADIVVTTESMLEKLKRQIPSVRVGEHDRIQGIPMEVYADDLEAARQFVHYWRDEGRKAILLTESHCLATYKVE